MECKNCQGSCIKKGCQNRRQKYYCKFCKSYQQKTYSYKKCTKQDEETIIKLNNEGVGISSISRITGISKSNVVNKIKSIASKIIAPAIKENQQEYEVDEMYTFISNKKNPCYIIYAINRKSKQVIDFTVGQRTKENIKKVIQSINRLNPLKIHTDKLNVYPNIIKKSTHSTIRYRTNRIERFNLTLRTHLKRLSRKTICYSKSILMLWSCLKIYFGAIRKIGMENHC